MPIDRPLLFARRLGLFLLCAGAVLLPLAGCQPGDDIQHYNAPRVETPMVRLTVAIFKSGDSTWFFKLIGPKDLVDQHADEFEQFLTTVTFGGAAKEPVQFKAPDGWEKEPPDSQRYAAWQIGPKDAAAELTVVRLGEKAGSLLLNVNRWRGQLGLKDIADADLKDLCAEEKIGNQTVTRVDMTATGRFRKTTGPKMPMEMDKGNGAPQLKYDKPAGWEEMSTPPRFAVVGFAVKDREQSGLVSVSPMAPQPLLGNVNRWREQIGLAKLRDEGQLKDVVQRFEVGSISAQSLDLVGDGQRILIVMLPHDGSTWIFKMIGSPDLVGTQKAAFEQFVRSVRFDGGSDE